MNAPAQSQNRMPRLRDVCPGYREACDAYDKAVKSGSDNDIQASWQRMAEIAQAFNAGAEYGQREHRPDRIRVWQAGAR